jgi:S-DNA-T family DNA segregation ATPase FtsK/SpoIIIE
MPKPQISNPNSGRSFQPPRQLPNWVAAVGCGLVATLLAVAFFDYNPNQDPFHTTNPTDSNLVGVFGSYGSSVAFRSLGMTAWFIPIFLFWLSFVSVRRVRLLTGSRLITMVVCIAAFSGLATMFAEHKSTDYFPYGLGGLLGRLVYMDLLQDTLGAFGSILLLGTVYIFGLLFIFTKDIGAEFEKIAADFGAWRRTLSRPRAAAVPAQAPGKPEAAPESAPAPAPFGPADKKVFVPKAGNGPPAEPARPAKAALDGKFQLKIVKPEETKKARTILPQSADDNYTFPPLKLLKEQVGAAASSSEEEHSQNAGNLMRILGEFGVDVTLGEIHVGPVITRYEVVPAAGVRVERISSLDKNIALGMRAQSVRILAPIPGKAAVGVEVPNQHPTPVGIREVLESEDWVGARAELPIVLGKDVSGQPLVSDLAKMPHLLIAGATGSGKSVCVNAIVTSILYSKSPRDVRLIMVDPKVVELKIFNSLPHMLIPVLTEVKKVPGALKWLLAEMEQRYQIFGKTNVRNIVGFNHRRRGGGAQDAAQGALPGFDPPAAADDGIEVPEHMPYIVVIIDELADLMMIAPAEIETNVARLAQLARAAGIHLIIATQRPSVNVVTGVIKANLPSRIAFQMASQVDSRTVLDTKGAETLIGRGDMLFTPPGTSRVVRAQGAFVSDDEIQKIVAYLQENNDPPLYAHSVQQHIDRAAREDDEEGEFGEEGDMGDDDALYQQALDVLRATRRASTSMLQRRLRIGYNRAARIMELMEEKGIVGPENGSSPREILVDLDKI